MNWLDSSSFSGLLSQAQKSIDKVLDISTEDDSQSTTTGHSSETGNSQSPKSQEKKSSKRVEQKASSSWLSGGADSFWGSFTQNTSESPSKDTKEKSEKTFDVVETKNKTTSEKENNVPQKESKSPTKTTNLKRNGKKKVSKKKVETSDNHLNQVSLAKGAQENEAGNNIESLGTQSEGIKKQVFDSTDAKADVVSTDASDCKIFKNSNDDNLRSYTNIIGSENNANENDRVQENNQRESEVNNIRTNEDALMAENEGEKEKQNLENEVKMTEQVENTNVLGNDRNRKLESDGFANIDLLSNEETKVDDRSKKSRKVDVETMSDYGMEENKDEEPRRPQEEVVVEQAQNFDLFSSAPVAASTPFTAERNEPIFNNTDHNDELTNLDDLLKASELPENQNVEGETAVDLGSGVAQDSGDVMKVNEGVEESELREQVTDSVSKQENDRLLQIIEVRESKLVELSKENLNLQETNAILRSQIQQLEEEHESEDAELEQMKAEFTNRIGESEAKLQVAAKERDLFKKQLEETQKCLSSDMERQLKEFQSLLQQKDEQIAQLMEEGEKLSKQILQRNTNIKKLRAKEKELNTANENQSTRLEASETEIERLTGILKERDDHEKEQDDAIKKLNAYTKKQDDLIAKQKVELEESAAKLPSLQTALDNAYKEITELNKMNAAKSTEVQEATLSVEMTAKEELRIALEKLKKESQKECDVLAMEVTDLQTQLSRSEQQAARREDNLRQEIADIQMRLQEAETRNQELTQSVSVATRPLLRQIENIQHSTNSQQTSWEKLEKNLTERLSDAQSQLATAQEKERASTERSIELTSKVASLESQVANYRQEKSRIEAEFELDKTKLEALEEYKSRESGKVDALKVMHSKQLETMMVEKSLIEQQLVVERTKYESEKKKLTNLEEQLKERSRKPEDMGEAENQDPQHTALDRRRSRNSSSSSVFSLSDTMTRSLPSGGTAVLEELRATIRHKEGELVSMQSAMSTMEASRESLTEELTSLMNTNEDLSKENKQLNRIGKSFQELQAKYNALLQMYGEKEEETEELKLDLQDIKNMYKAQIQELLSGR